MQQQILSRTRLEPVIRNLSLYNSEINQVPMDDLVVRLRKTIEVTPVQPMARTNAQGLAGFTIGVTFPQAQLAQQICSTVTSMFLDENLRVRQNQAEQTTDFLTNQLDAAKAKLDEQDAKLATFQRAHLGALPEDQGTNLNVLGGLRYPTGRSNAGPEPRSAGQDICRIHAGSSNCRPGRRRWKGTIPETL